MRRDIELMVFFVMGSYALDAIGYIPHTMFWVDYLSREQALGTQAASVQWAVFGVGAICGPFVAGFAAHRLGCRTSLNLAFIAKAFAIAIPLLSIDLISRTASSFVVGAMVPSIVALTSARIVELVGPAEHKRYWGLATAVFAIAQAFSGYAMSALYDVWGSYYLLFAIGSGMLAGSFVLAVLGRIFLNYKRHEII